MAMKLPSMGGWGVVRRAYRMVRAKLKLRRLRRVVPADAADLFQASAFVADSDASGFGRSSSTVPMCADPITSLLNLAEEQFPLVRSDFKHLVILEQTLRMEPTNPFAFVPEPVLEKALAQARMLEEHVGKDAVTGMHLLTLKVRRHLLECEQRRQAKKPGAEMRWQPVKLPTPEPKRAPSLIASGFRLFDTTGPVPRRDFEATRPYDEHEDAGRKG